MTRKTTETMKTALINHKPFTRDDYIKAYRKLIDKEAKLSTISWSLYHLRNENAIRRIGSNKFERVREHNNSTHKNDYRTIMSERLIKIIGDTSHRFPNVRFVAWEIFALNEFLNHQLARNIIFIDVEKDSCESIFEYLKEELLTPVLFKADSDEINRYAKDETVVVGSLISETPLDKQEFWRIRIEKMLVDLLSSKSLRSMFNDEDIATIFNDACQKYYMEERALARYARRRSCEKKLRLLLPEKTEFVY